MTLIDKEIICKEIERRIENCVKNVKHLPCHRIEELCELLAFLDTLPEQKPKQEQDLPKWKIADKPIVGAMYIVRKVYGALVEHTVAQYVCEGEEYIIVGELEKLQKEK